jgi:tRNA_anti-like
MKRILIKRLVIIVSALLIGIAGIGSYLNNKPHRNIKTAIPDVATTSSSLFTSFLENEEYANKQFLDKVILVSGKIVEVISIGQNDVAIMLEGIDGNVGVICALGSTEITKAASLTRNQLISIKGRCTGIQVEVMLIDCFIQ